MPDDRKPDSIFNVIDIWQQKKYGRMAYLLNEIEAAKEIGVPKFLGSIAVKYGIREYTGREYLRDWVNAGCIAVDNNTIKFLKKLE